MVRLAQPQDIEWITEGMLSLKHATGWSQYVQPGYNQQSLTSFLSDRLYDSNSVCYVWDADTRAFVGGSLSKFYLPPFMPLVFEWGWFGGRRECVELWQRLCEWGKGRGAELAGYVRANPARRSGCIDEHVTWKVL